MRIPHGTLSLQRKMGLYAGFHAFLLLLAGVRQTLKGPSQVGCDDCAAHKLAIPVFTLHRRESATMPRKQKPPAEWSRRRTRYDPPTLAEAITAAQCLTAQIESQIEITAQLMGVPEEEVRSEVLKAAVRTTARHTGSVCVHQRRTEVVVERRGPRIARP
jgi:hypothetical protein